MSNKNGLKVRVILNTQDDLNFKIEAHFVVDLLVT